MSVSMSSAQRSISTPKWPRPGLGYSNLSGRWSRWSVLPHLAHLNPTSTLDQPPHLVPCEQSGCHATNHAPSSDPSLRWPKHANRRDKNISNTDEVHETLLSSEKDTVGHLSTEQLHRSLDRHPPPSSARARWSIFPSWKFRPADGRVSDGQKGKGGCARALAKSPHSSIPSSPQRLVRSRAE